MTSAALSSGASASKAADVTHKNSSPLNQTL
jgi:hypothetical protein